MLSTDAFPQAAGRVVLSSVSPQGAHEQRGAPEPGPSVEAVFVEHLLCAQVHTEYQGRDPCRQGVSQHLLWRNPFL